VISNCGEWLRSPAMGIRWVEQLLPSTAGHGVTMRKRAGLQISYGRKEPSQRGPDICKSRAVLGCIRRSLTRKLRRRVCQPLLEKSGCHPGARRLPHHFRMALMRSNVLSLLGGLRSSMSFESSSALLTKAERPLRQPSLKPQAPRTTARRTTWASGSRSSKSNSSVTSWRSACSSFIHASSSPAS
jgi:hypothetical protein